MTLTLLVLAMVAAANPARVLTARPRAAGLGAGAVALAASLVLVWLSALLSGPLLEAVDVTGPSARIAAGIALLVVALKDVFLPPPHPEPALAGWRSGLLPLAFPVIFSPAFALLAVAGASERGVAVAVSAAVLALIPVAALLGVNRTGQARAAVATVGALGAGVAALVVLDGVYAI